MGLIDTNEIAWRSKGSRLKPPERFNHRSKLETASAPITHITHTLRHHMVVPIPPLPIILACDWSTSSREISL